MGREATMKILSPNEVLSSDPKMTEDARVELAYEDFVISFNQEIRRKFKEVRLANDGTVAELSTYVITLFGKETQVTTFGYKMLAERLAETLRAQSWEVDSCKSYANEITVQLRAKKG